MRTALVVDDSAVIRKVARHIFETLGLEVREAEDGRTALELCAQLMPDVILLDGSMPKMDGYAVLRGLREAPGGVHPKVLFCAVENDVGAIARARRGGADDYVLKPFDRETLTAKLEQAGLAA